MKLLFFHDTTKAKVCNHDVCILGFGPEEEVLGLEV
jgi:hypothetical protein